MPAKFQIKSAKNGKFFFNLLAGNGEPILTSQMYASKATAKKGIASVRDNGKNRSMFVEKTNKAGKHFFVLRAKNNQVIGNGEAYSGKSAMKNGIGSVVKAVAKAKIDDVS